MRYRHLFIILLVATKLAAQSTVESIPNQKLINGSYVSNPDNILDGGTVTEIDTLLKLLERKTSVQVAVVVLESIGDDDVFEFAQNLFITWGIGNKQNDNGLLVLLVNDQHTIRFHTGDGLEGVLPDVVCKRIQRDYMLPEFKNGNYNAGMLGGLQQVEKILVDPSYSQELSQPEENEISDWLAFVIFLSVFVSPVLLILFIVKASKGRFADSKKPDHTPYPEMRMSRWAWLLEFVGIPLLIIGIIGIIGISAVENPSGLCFASLYFYYLLTAFHRLWRIKKVINRFLGIQDYYEIVEFLRKQQWYWFFMAVLFPLPFVFYFFYHLARKKIYRNHPRNCKQCHGALFKLNEKTEDEYLTEGQQTEEKLRAVDYDVWKCESCESVEFWFYLNRNSKYEPCPKCKTIAYCSVNKHTIVNASYTSSGSGEELHSCQHCGHQDKSTYTISQLTRSTTSGTTSMGSSSSSSGGSWGGGSSGGGGASSKW